ncbi:DUF1254 domain-containing protein [Flammeovirga sp. OC4]|uniref:DUF1254 domain-containing protein n=1 Tax=Flammeovirga sp. OC4 TaxID=1382345 RepID=UPI00069399E0|nr:DUF1254 domain-containing protein [Flammeovirga sp. OC4]
MKKDIIAKVALASVLLSGCNTTLPTTETVKETKTDSNSMDTRIGKLDFTHGFENGYPTEETVHLLFDEMDFQRATQAYIWATPYVSFLQWQHSFHHELGLKNGQIILHESYKDRVGGLTYNATTPYALTFIEVQDDPWIMEVPEGGVRGSMSNMWQIGLASFTEPTKFLILGPETKMPEGDLSEYKVVRSNTNSVMTGLRLMSPDKEERMKVLDNYNIYPYSEREDPHPRGYIETNERPWMAAAPRGLEYFERLAEGINANGPIHERDRFFMAMLKPLGIERGKPFEPTAYQKEILTEAAYVGEAMTKAIDFDGTERLEDAPYMEGSVWEIATTSPPNQRRENMDALDGRAAWFYEAVSNDIAMHGMVNGGYGQVYLTSYKDADGDWLDGGQNYRLRLPDNPPAKAFWSVTLYEVNTRTLLQNEMQKADLSSRQDLKVNMNGSIDLYFGPKAPKGFESNWIQTEEGRAWFPYFRFYSPGKEVVDRTWVLPDIEKKSY